jgi:hypothetical protein
MILSKFVEVTINKRNKKHFFDLGYNTESDKVNVLIKDISINSHYKIIVKCDYCNNEKLLSIKNYNKSVSVGGKYACSQKCSYIKKSEILIEEKGIENIEVASHSFEKYFFTMQPITAFAQTSPKAKVMKITDEESGKSIVVTPEHKVFTKNRGYVMAKDLIETDELMIIGI